MAYAIVIAAAAYAVWRTQRGVRCPACGNRLERVYGWNKLSCHNCQYTTSI